MSNKIDAYQSLAGRTPVTGRAPVKTAQAAVDGNSNKAVASITATDSVSLTGDAVQLQKFEKTLSASPASNSGKVDQLRQAISKGSYQVDAKAVASKLSRFEFTLGNA